jgi:NADH dehydrogenase
MADFGKGFFGFGGAGRLQPVYVGDVARAFVDAIENAKAVHQSYDLAGPDVTSWPDLHRAFAKAFTGKRRLVAPLPSWYAKLVTRIVPGSLLPFNRDQVLMSQEDNTAPIGKFVSDFGWTPRPFEQTLASYAREVTAE